MKDLEKSVHMLRALLGTLITCILPFAASTDRLPICPQNNVAFTLTECDDENGFWRVAVPRNESFSCIPETNAPLRIHGCETTCNAGYFYSLDVVNCTKCEAGTYSAGNSQTYDDWHVLPAGFLNQTAPLLQPIAGRGMQGAQGANCADQAWTLRGDHLSLSEGEGCISDLLFEVDIIQDQNAFVKFDYQYPETNLLFVFVSLPAECAVGSEGKQQSSPMSTFPEHTVRNAWFTSKVELLRGKQTLVWRVVSMSATQQQNSYKPIRIRSIEVMGVKYSKSCTACPAGTFSDAGSSRCTECPINFASSTKSAACHACPKHQYALPGFPECLDRKPCTDKDYAKVLGSCGADKMLKLSYAWIEPMICQSDSITLPDSKDIPCPPCSPGMMPYNATTCGTCETGQFVNTDNKCQTCDGGLNPAYSYDLVSWNYLPSSIEILCWSPSMGCARDFSWQLNSDYISSGYGHEDDSVLVLQLFTTGFRKQITEGAYGKLLFDFELDCSANCELGFVMENVESSESTEIKTWHSKQQRDQFRYTISHNSSLVFTWIFTKMNSQKTPPSLTKGRRFGHDVVKIYKIQLDNTLDGGASSCEACDGADQQCLHCAPNEFWNLDLKKCQRCPPGSVVSPVSGKCVPCGPNLRPSGKNCVSDCMVFLSSGRNYNLTALKGFHETSTKHLFQPTGEDYYHIFNISFCQDSPVVCSNTAHRSGNSLTRSSVSGQICRTTHITSKQLNSTNSALSFVAGQKLVGVTESSVLEGIFAKNSSEFADIQTQFPAQQAPDFHYYFRSLTSTSTCLSGRTTVITMRCSKNTTSLHDIRVPINCPDGTCDGCNFRLMWLTPYACPVCSRPDDYLVVKGECAGGQQNVYYSSKPYCHEVNSSASLVKKVQCHAVPFAVQVLIIALTLCGIALTVLVVFLYKSAKKYEHRYMKLVQDASGVIHLQLPESCVDDHDLDTEPGEDPDNEPTDRAFNVEFRTPSETVFTKVRKAITKKKDLTRDRPGFGGNFRESEENQLLTD